MLSFFENTVYFSVVISLFKMTLDKSSQEVFTDLERKRNVIKRRKHI